MYTKFTNIGLFNFILKQYNTAILYKHFPCRLVNDKCTWLLFCYVFTVTKKRLLRDDVMSQDVDMTSYSDGNDDDITKVYTHTHTHTYTHVHTPTTHIHTNTHTHPHPHTHTHTHTHTNTQTHTHTTHTAVNDSKHCRSGHDILS